MLDVSKINYRLVLIDNDGGQYDVSEICAALGWSEGEKELASKITFKLAVDAETYDKIFPGVQTLVYADTGGGFVEVARGKVTKLELHEANGEFTLSVECADECHALRHSQDDYYFSPTHGGEEILQKIFDDHGVPNRIEIQDEKLGKKVYRKKYLSDMIQDVLTDLKERGKGFYFIRAKEGVVEIIPRGTNDEVFHFDTENSAVSVKESFDASKVATKVKVAGKLTDEGHQRVDAVVEGDTSLGERQIIYHKGDKETQAEAETAAQKILDENQTKRKTTLEAPDVPTLRKGDRIRLRAALGESFFFVKSIRHDAAKQKMTLELDEDKEKNKELGLNWDTAHADESDSSAAP